MRAVLKICSSLLVVLALAVRAEDCPLVVPVSNAGWYNGANFHDPENNNYIVGHHAAGPTELRNFFVFDLPALQGPVGGAQLRIYTFSITSPQGAETYELHHVATPVGTLVAGAGPGLTNVFNDLGDGALYATRPVTNSEANGYITLTLNSNALAAIQAASGQRFALGGRVSSLAAAPGQDEKLFAFSSGTPPYVELTVTFAGTNAPFIYQSPPPLVMTNSGFPVSLSVAACGAEPLRYRWYFNDTPLNQTNRTLTLGSPGAGSSGRYFAVVTNLFGAATSAPAQLVVDGAPPVIYYLPATQSVAVGFPFTFTPFVAGAPPPALQWFLAGLEIPGATNLYYDIPNVQTYHATTFSLRATNLLGAATDHAALQVEPLLLYGPDGGTFLSGSDVYLSVSTVSSVPVTYQWRLQGTNLPGATGRLLTLTNLPPEDSAQYSVVVGNVYGTRTSEVAIITSYASAPMAYAPYSPLPPRLGHDMVLQQQAQGTRPMTFQWFFNGQPLSGATNSDLVLGNFSPNQNGEYTYTVSNSLGGATSPSVTLAAGTAGPELSPFLASRDVFTGDRVALQATVQGSPPRQLQWRRNGTNLPGATNFLLLFTNVARPDAGYYVLQASNPAGQTTIGISLDVQPRRALDRWTWHNSQPQANDLRQLASGNGRLVAGGEGGSLVTSTNGADWITITLGNQFRVERIVFGQGRFVALVSSPSDPDLLFHSTDGVNWQPRALPLFEGYTLDFVNGEFFLTGSDGAGPAQLARSTDAMAWTKRALPTYAGPQLVACAFGNGRYVAAGPLEVMVSPDAVNWERAYVPATVTRLTFGNGLFVMTTVEGVLWTSLNGRHWLAHNTPLLPTVIWRGLAAGAGQFVAVGENGALVRSTDGQTWTTANPTTTRDLRDVVFTGTQFVVAGYDGVLLTSPDGASWSDRRSGRTRDLYGIVYTNGQFVTVGYEGSVLTSPDARMWTVRSSGTTRNLHGVTYAAGQHVAVGRNGTVITSPNGINWITRPTPTTNYLERVAWGGGRFVIVGTGATILTSTNGFTWQAAANPAPATTELEGIAYGQGRFVAVGNDNNGQAHSVMLVSSNGLDWASTTVDVGKGLRGATYGGNRFLAIGNDGVTLFSSDGLAWIAPQYVAPFRNWRHATYALGHLVVVGNEGALVSADALGWHPRASIVSQNLHDIAYGAGKFVAVGNAGTIVQSDFAVPFISGSRLTNGLMRFNVTGGLEAEYQVQSSIFFNFWQNEATYTNDDTGAVFSLPTNPIHGFFRVTSP